MTTTAKTSSPTVNLVNFWNEAGLRVAHAKSGSVQLAPSTVPWRAAIEDVLKVAYAAQTQSRFAAAGWQRIRWRTAPSAGALYPYELVVSVVGGGSYLWDVEQGRLVPSGLAPLTREDVAAAGIATTLRDPPAALLIVLARPWLSMKKYRNRGYLYCHLDVGHVTTNLAIYTAALGLTPSLHLRFCRAFLARHLKLDGLCREPLTVLALSGAGPEVHPLPHGALDADAHPGPGPHAGCFALPEEREMQNWESLRGVVSFDCRLAPPCAPAAMPLLLEPAEPRDDDSAVPLPLGRPPLASPAECRSAILNRRSAKGFVDSPLTCGQIGELLDALRPPGVPADCAPETAARLGVRLVARNVEGLAGVFGYLPRDHALRRVDERAGDPRPACMAQEIARHAAALLVLHAPIGSLVALQGYSALAEVHFHAAQLAQRLHLAATRIGALGITCLGGFDGEQCALLAGLAAGDEAVYVILVGVPDDSAFKHDRSNVAFSHGLTTVEN